jgi:hypothetical protein
MVHLDYQKQKDKIRADVYYVRQNILYKKIDNATY